jgi:CBS domain containing-hemolysin-like protein
MTKTYHALPHIKLSKNNNYDYQEHRPELVHLDDSALDVMINLEKKKPLTASPKDSIDDTLIDMKASGAHIMVVVEDEKVVGVISSEDILGERPMQVAEDRRIKRDQILVRSVMTPQEKLAAIDYEEVRFAKIGNIISTLRDTKQHYAIVVNTSEDSDEQMIHGIIYIYDIIKRLNKDLVTELRAARSILELKRDFD